LSEHLEHTNPRAELAELASATLSLMEWYAGTGALAVPIEGNAEALLTALAAGPAPAAPPPAARPAPPAYTRPAVPAAAAAFASAALSTAVPAPRIPAPIPAPAPVPVPVPAASSDPPAAEISADERRTRLALLADEARSCTKCGLHEQRQQAVFARGNPFSEVCFVGEGPGAEEDARGEPFVGAAGQLLDKMIAAMGYRRDDVYICNIVKCRPPNNRKPEPAEMATCTPFLTAQLGLIRPRVIVALGATAVQGLIGTTEGITRLRGKWKLYKGSIPIMPTFHPAYLLRNPPAKREVWADLQEVMRHLGKAVPAKG